MNKMVTGVEAEKQRALDSISRNLGEIVAQLRSISRTLESIERKIDYNEQTKKIDAIE